MSDMIFVNGLAFHAYHGVAEHEGRVGQTFVLDLVLEIDLAKAARSDKVADTASYDDIVAVARRAFCAQPFKLVEAAAGAVAEALLGAFAQVTRVWITVRKPHAPIAATFHDVGVTIARARHD
jgi:dihydroneopterin aldolase